MQIAQLATELAVADLVAARGGASCRARLVMASVWASVSKIDMGGSIGARR
jgi:hypothetical protein